MAEVTEALFQEKLEAWLEETKFSSSMGLQFQSTQELINLGVASIPFLLREIMNHPQLCIVMRAVVGADHGQAVTPGKMRAIAIAWRKWGKEAGYDIRNPQERE